MKTVLSSQAAKYLKRLNEPDKSRIIKALKKLEIEPPQGDIKNLTGKDGYRLRVGGYRILFDVINGTVAVHAIAPRGQAYKGGF
ncbi:MAG: type II toxin-antitoxin system RelE/ParE family toxin [Oscillospiraceae bacterium]|jgi:mRNA interferase RelE/StbE|nr:type II toxin-antitoxin system RelE/ParE family toxin [Oscillospiraceae bacterium]